MMMAVVIAKYRIRSGSFTVLQPRSVCTETKIGCNYKQLYRRLLDSKSSIADTMIAWKKEEKAVNGPSLTNVVWFFRRSGSYHTALELANWMKREELELNSSYHAVQLDLLSKVKGASMAEKYFSDLPEQEKTTKIYGALLSIYCQEKMEDEAIALFQKLKQLNLTFNKWCYNHMMSLYKRLENPRKVFVYFQEMKAANIAPDTCTFDRLCYISLHNIITVEDVFDEMVKFDSKLEQKLYFDLASYYNSEGARDKTLYALKKAELFFDRSNRSSYYRLMILYAKCGMLMETERIWNLLNSSFVRNSNLCYYKYLSALKILGEVKRIEKRFEEWESQCVCYDVKLLNLMTEVYLSMDMVEKAEMLREKGKVKGFGANSKAIQLFTDYYLERHKIDKALRCLKEFDFSDKKCQWKPNIEKVKSFFGYFDEVKDVEGADFLCRILKHLNFLDAEVYESLISHIKVA